MQGWAAVGAFVAYQSASRLTPPARSLNFQTARPSCLRSPPVRATGRAVPCTWTATFGRAEHCPLDRRQSNELSAITAAGHQVERALIAPT